MVELSKRHRLQGKSQMYECLACSFHYITLNMCTHRKEGGGGIIQKAKKLHHQILSTEALSEDLDRPHQAAPKMHDDNHIIARYVRIYGLLYQLHARSFILLQQESTRSTTPIPLRHPIK
jgi:hypothetical protein